MGECKQKGTIIIEYNEETPKRVYRNNVEMIVKLKI